MFDWKDTDASWHAFQNQRVIRNIETPRGSRILISFLMGVDCSDVKEKISE